VTDLEIVQITSKVEEWPTIKVVEEATTDPDWQPRPFVEFVVKLNSRCNLSCDYCYVYELQDESWKDQPKSMTKFTIDKAAQRFGEHMRAHRDQLDLAKVVLHGGEPLLAGAELIGYLATKFREETPAGMGIDFRVTTNGTLLDDAILEVLSAHEINVYVSLDGEREANDRHRKYANGNGSFDTVLRGIEALTAPRHQGLFAGVLCTIDIENDPVETYDTLVSLGSPMIDFLLPHGNWTQPPPAWEGPDGGTPYADWLMPIFDRWYDAPVKPISVRIFDEILNLILGGHSSIEVVGLSPFQSLTIDTNGSIDFCHQLKSAYSGAQTTGLHVLRDSLDSLLLHPGVVARQRGTEALCETCTACPIGKVCGGGLYAHRYRAGTGYLNPSVYCSDLFKLITYMRDRVLSDIRSATEGAGAAKSEATV